MVLTSESAVAFSFTVGSRTVSANELPHLLERYDLMPQLVRELVVDETIASIRLSSATLDEAIQQFRQRNQLATDEQLQAWLSQNQMTLADLQARLERTLKIEQYKTDRWDSQLENIFLKQKTQFDKAVYSLIRTSDPYAAQEFFFRLQEGEQSFSEIASQFSQGPEAKTGGMVGPVPLGNIHPALIQILSSSQPGQLHPPMRLDKWNVIVRLEQMLPAQLDDAMRQTLLKQLYENWLNERVAEVLEQNSDPAMTEV